MGRIFETRKHKMFARYAKMAKAFTKIGREIAIAVKSGGPDPNINPRLRLVMQNAKSVNMPKERVDAAIQRAAGKDEKAFEEVVYEGYGPYGIAVLVETATDNPTRTVANVRVHFNRCEGELGKTGSLDFLFDRKGVFRISTAGHNMEELELELIDAGLESFDLGDNDEAIVYCQFIDFGNLQKGLEAKNIQVLASSLERIPQNTIQLNPEQRAEVMKLIDRLEEDDDVQNVYHNMADEE
ncbi:MAG: hypothetical protein FD123_768 [Bacteroidetes bacterium]|nr:MAG: hypothetical protein FD123_768 [Bacteroidota bacterium]